MPAGPADVFDTAALRARVLDAWRASPARLREDANAEEDAALGAYRDRLVVELAQNAADAATTAGVEGRLLLRLLDDPDGGPGRLLAANTGSPLDAAGVLGLSTLRASAKRDQPTVGRFGVGFSAVLAVTDSPVIASTSGAVRFSRMRSAELVRAVPELADELGRRAGHVPALRLPFPAPDATAPPAGYDTVVELTLKDTAARALVEDLLTGVDDVLLLALPQLRELVLERPDTPPLVLRDVDQRWDVLRRNGSLDPTQLLGRGSEDRTRTRFEVTWALPRTPGTRAPGIVCAPTPTDEDLPWPAVLLATFPLGPDRRRLAPGAATDAILDAAAEAYGDLLVRLAGEGRDALALLPYGAAAGRVDAELRQRVLSRARDLPLLVAVETGATEVGDGDRLLLRPSSAIALTGVGAGDPALLAALAPSLAGLVAAPHPLDRLLTELGVTRLGLADALELLPGTGGTSQARTLFAALASFATDPVAREAMTGVPVPLLDGRVVHGPRGTLVLEGPSGLDPEAAQLLARFGLRLVDPYAVDGPGRDLLVRLGAREGGAWALLTDPAIAAAVAASPDAEDPDALADAVLGIVDVFASAGEQSVERLVRELPFLADLALADTDGDLAPAGALVVPGSLASRALDPHEVAEVDPDLLREWGAMTLRGVGVLTGPAVLRLAALDLADVGDAQADGIADLDDYVDEVWPDLLDGDAEETVLEEALAVRDLDLVVREWPDVLAALASTPSGLAALGEPWVVGAHRRPGLTAWWLRRSGPLPPLSRDPAGSAPDWLPSAPEWALALPVAARAGLGVLRDLADAGSDDVLRLLAGSTAAGTVSPGTVSAGDLLALWALLALHAENLLAPAEPPPALLVLDGAATRVASSDAVLVPDSPAWAQRADLGPTLLVPASAAAAVADLLDLDLASDRADGVPSAATGETVVTPGELRAWLPGMPAHWTRVEDLCVDAVPVAFWVHYGDVLARDVAGAAAGLAQVAGSWSARSIVAAVLGAPAGERAELLAVELPGA